MTKQQLINQNTELKNAIREVQKNAMNKGFTVKKDFELLNALAYANKLIQ